MKEKGGSKISLRRSILCAPAERCLLPYSFAKAPNYGIKELYNGGANASIDIVFVHGLDRKHIHYVASQRLRRALAERNCSSKISRTRASWAFGYDADVVKLWNPASNSRLSNHAENMVGALVRKRETHRYGEEKDLIYRS